MLEGVTWFRQAAFRWQGEGPVVYVDPWGINDDVPADVIMITHAHEDHLQPHQIEKLRKPDTKVVATRDVANEISGDVMVMGKYDASTGQCITMDDLVGAHGGTGGMQTQPFVLFPAGWTDRPGEIIGADGLHHPDHQAAEQSGDEPADTEDDHRAERGDGQGEAQPEGHAAGEDHEHSGATGEQAAQGEHRQLDAPNRQRVPTN